MGEATLEQALRELGTTVVADLPLADVLGRVAELAAEIGVDAAVELTMVDSRGRAREEARAGVAASGGPESRGDRLSVELVASGLTLGTLTFHARQPGPISESQARAAQAFAEQAAALLANARAYWDLHEVASGLQSAMQSRAVIEQAKGKLMAIEGFSPDEAFTRLARVSQSENVKLRELARQVVDEDRRL
jgi:hypothetical protein